MHTFMNFAKQDAAQESLLENFNSMEKKSLSVYFLSKLDVSGLLDV